MIFCFVSIKSGIHLLLMFTLLYVLIILLASFEFMRLLFDANFCIGSSIRRNSCRHHSMLPAVIQLSQIFIEKMLEILSPKHAYSV